MLRIVGKAGFKVYDVTERSEEQGFESLAFVLRVN
jgi:hypothetical protein